jgi:DNA adenine methylase
MSIPQPIPYQGSKRQLAPAIAGYFPVNAQRLIEPFAGSAALSVYSAHTGKIHQFWLNDINEPLIRLWEILIHNPAQLADQYEHLWYAQMGQERTFYDSVRERFNDSHRPDDLLYLLARCVKAAVRYNARGEFNQSPDNRRKGRQPDTMRRDILKAAQLLHDVRLTAQDYRAVLSFATKNDVVYMDPPYQGVCANRDPRYFQGIDIEAFIEALDDLNTRQIPYLVSYDGRTGTKVFGKPLPEFLHLQQIEISAGRSSQATLLRRKVDTFEALYVSPTLMSRLERTVPPIAETHYQLPPLPESA